MKTLNFDSIEEFCEEFNECIETVHNANENKYVSVVAKYEEAKEIIRELVYYDYGIAQIEVNDPNWDDYDDEYEISVINGEIFCSKMKSNNKYLTSYASVVFFMEDVNSKCISAFPEAIFEYEVQIDDECDDMCCECKKDDNISFYPVKEDGEMHGFTCSRSDENGYVSHSFYSTECLKPDVMDRVINILKLI